MERMRVTHWLLIVVFVAGAAAAQSLDIVTEQGVAHFAVEKVGLRKTVHAVVDGNDGSAEFTFDGRTIQFGDGYSIVRQTLTNSPGEMVMKLTATSPEGSSASAVILYNRRIGSASATGFEQFSEVIDRSADARLTRSILAARPASRPRLPLSSMTILGDCVKYCVAFASATLTADVTCGTGNLAGCTAALIAVGVAADGMTSSCPSNSLDDGTIGWG